MAIIKSNHPTVFSSLILLLISSIVSISIGDVNALTAQSKHIQVEPAANAYACNAQSTTRRSLFDRSLLAAFSSGGIAIGAPLIFSPPPALAAAETQQKKLTFQTLESGVRVADILEGTNGGASVIVTSNSKVNVHLLGRLLGKQGWIFEDSQAAGEDPFRLDLGTGTVIPGLEEGLIGMKPGGRRRIVVPSAVGYTSRKLEPIPREFSNKQRLYTTVMNSERIERERQALGADLAGVVVFDVELLRVRN